MNWDRQAVEQDASWQWHHDFGFAGLCFYDEALHFMLDRKRYYKPDVQQTLDCLYYKSRQFRCDKTHCFTALSLYDKYITNLEPLAYLQDLWFLDLESNRGIRDIRPLKNLTKLRELFLAYSYDIDDIRPLATLIKLEKLSLQHNKISNIEPLGHLTNLKELDLAHNQISSIESLASLKALKILKLSRTRSKI